MLHIIAGGSGTGKSTLLMQKIRQLLPQEPDCIILVPEQFSYEFDKKLYHFLGATAFNQLETHSFTSISRMLFQKYGKHAAQYADATVRKALFLQAVQTVRQNQVLYFFDRRCCGGTEQIPPPSLKRHSNVPDGCGISCRMSQTSIRNMNHFWKSIICRMP